MSKDTILITGGAGFIGTHLAERFRSTYHVVLFDNLRRNSLRYAPVLESDRSVELVEGDVLDCQAVSKVVRRADVVLHLAAIAGVSSYYSQPSRTLRVNIVGTMNVLDAMREHGVRRLVEFSTSEVYGAEALNAQEDSTHSIGPVHEQRWVYAVSKLASENIALRWGEEFGLDCTCVRPFNIYGPRQTGEGAISNFCAAARDGQAITIYGDGADERAWCFVTDLVDGIQQVLQVPESIGHSINLGNPDAVLTTSELAEQVVATFGCGRIVRQPAEHAPIRKRSPNIEKAKRLLGFHPKIGIREGIEKTIHWYMDSVTR